MKAREIVGTDILAQYIDGLYQRYVSGERYPVVASITKGYKVKVGCYADEGKTITLNIRDEKDKLLISISNSLFLDVNDKYGIKTKVLNDEDNNIDIDLLREMLLDSITAIKKKFEFN